MSLVLKSAPLMTRLLCLPAVPLWLFRNSLKHITEGGEWVRRGLEWVVEEIKTERRHNAVQVLLSLEMDMGLLWLSTSRTSETTLTGWRQSGERAWKKYSWKRTRESMNNVRESRFHVWAGIHLCQKELRSSLIATCSSSVQRKINKVPAHRLQAWFSAFPPAKAATRLHLVSEATAPAPLL